MAEVKITVLMPVYNGEQFLPETIESVQAQTCTDWEFLILDDGSTDRSAEIVRQYAEKDDRIRFVQNEHNMGVARTLNRGLSLARGAYIARVDADDPLYRTRLAAQSAFLDAHPEVGVLGSGSVWERPDTTFIHFPGAASDAQIKADFPFENRLAHSTLMIRKSVLDETGMQYDPNYKLEDYELWTRLARHTQFAVLRQPLIKHREYDGSVCGQMGDAFYQNCCKISKKYLSDVLETDFSAVPDRCFGFYKLDPNQVVEGDSYLYLSQLFEVLAAIEAGNAKTGFLDKQRTLDFLKHVWNWTLSQLKANYKPETGLGVPYAPQEKPTGFVETLYGEMRWFHLVEDTDAPVAAISRAIRESRKKIVVYGLGQQFYTNWFPVDTPVQHARFSIVALSDKQAAYTGAEIQGVPVVLPEQLARISCDFVAVTPEGYFDTIRGELVQKYHLPEEKILPASQLL